MAGVDVIVIGASAGGLQALLDIVAALPASLPAAVLVTVHTPTESTSRLPQILARATPLAVRFAEHGDRLAAGHIYVARPDVHLLIDGDSLALNHGPRQNGFRPAIDPMFRSAADAFGPRAMGVVVSGALDDGTYGLARIKAAGGTAVAQDPEEALVASMPLSAIRNVEVDHVLPAAQIGELIASRAGKSFNGVPEMASKTTEQPLDEREITVQQMNGRFGPPSAMTCPDCGGALWELQEGKLTRFRCHVGHQFSPEALDRGQHDLVEEALWTAVRALEEHADLRQRMSRRADLAGLSAVAGGFADTARTLHHQAQTIRDLLLSDEPEWPVETAAGDKRETPATAKRTSRTHARRTAKR
jgi:two-component system chemotaxis response regulator CheB